jgi:DNA polymerase-3 subunit delta'
MSFKEIFCQDRAIDILQRAFSSGRWAHAYIFAGLDGIGKFKTACEWAKLLLCEKPAKENGFWDSCGLCRSCRAFQENSHPDFNHVYKELREFTEEGKDKAPPVDLPIDVIREFLTAKVSIKPSLSARKVFVVSEAEKLNAHSQNSLLKVLEEPPAYCCIVLLCTRLEKMLPTIKSRSQIVRFGPVSQDKIIKQLEKTGLDKQQCRYFAGLAQGSMGQACRLAQLELADVNLYQVKKELISSLATYHLADALDLANMIIDRGKNVTDVWTKLDKTTSKTDISRRALTILIQVVISAMQDVMKFGIEPAMELINFDQKDEIKGLAVRFNPEQAAERISDCYKMLQWLESNVNEKLIIEQLLLNMVDSVTI